MNIAQICPYDIDRPGGVQKHIRDVAATLVEMGHEAAIIAPRVSGLQQETMGGVTVHRLGAARKIAFGHTGYEISIANGKERRALRKLIQESGFDILHFHTMWTPIMPFQAFRDARSATVHTFHDTAPNTLLGRVLRFAFNRMSRALLPRLDAAIAVSTGPMGHLHQMPERKIHVVPPCTDLRPFENAEPFAQYRDGRLTILFLGRLERRKGVMLLLQAYRRLCADGPKLRLLIAGTGDMETDMRAYVAEHALPHVEFTGLFASADALRFYASADIFCAPSPYGESFGIVVAEAMAAGKPVVAAANSGYHTLLQGEGARFLVEPGSSEALYEGLHEFVQNEALRARMGKWGREEAGRYDCANVVPQLLEIYDEALASHRARQSS